MQTVITDPKRKEKKILSFSHFYPNLCVKRTQADVCVCVCMCVYVGFERVCTWGWWLITPAYLVFGNSVVSHKRQDCFQGALVRQKHGILVLFVAHLYTHRHTHRLLCDQAVLYQREKHFHGDESSKVRHRK